MNLLKCILQKLTSIRGPILRKAIARMNIHKCKKQKEIAKKKDEITKHLEAGYEVKAKIWVWL